jgi:hypothetical protein
MTSNVPLTALAGSGSTSRRYDPAGLVPIQKTPCTHFVGASTFDVIG